MAKKKSISIQCKEFENQIEEILDFLQFATECMSDKQISWSHDYALIRTYRVFENLILNCLIASINQDTAGTIGLRKGLDFPKNIKDEVCEYLIVKDGYFDFKGRNGLITELKKYLPDDHFFIKIIKKQKYKDTLDQLVSLRNFAAHDSKKSKQSVKRALKLSRIGSSGSWVKKQNRFNKIASKLNELVKEIDSECSY